MIDVVKATIDLVKASGKAQYPCLPAAIRPNGADGSVQIYVVHVEPGRVAVQSVAAMWQ